MSISNLSLQHAGKVIYQYNSLLGIILYSMYKLRCDISQVKTRTKHIQGKFGLTKYNHHTLQKLTNISYRPTSLEIQSSKGRSARSRVVLPHVFNTSLSLVTNMLLSLQWDMYVPHKQCNVMWKHTQYRYILTEVPQKVGIHSCIVTAAENSTIHLLKDNFPTFSINSQNKMNGNTASG